MSKIYNINGAIMHEDANLTLIQLVEKYKDFLEGANLEGTHLEGAHLKGANLEGANLEGAKWDFSCLPLWCGSFGMITDDRFTKQIARHLADAMVNRDDLNDEEKALLKLLIPYGNQFPRDDVKKLDMPIWEDTNV